jgi:hypothetical protein
MMPQEGGVSGIPELGIAGPALLVLDLDLAPQISARQVVADARRGFPFVPIVAVAGMHAEARLLEAFAEPGVDDLVPKRGAGRAAVPGTSGRAWPDENALYSAVRRRQGGWALGASLLAGAPIHEERIHSSRQRRPALARAALVLRRMALPDDKVNRIELVCEELLMNALYDAPCDGGKPRFAHLDRRVDVDLAPDEEVILRLGTDGQVVALSVSDPYGAMSKEVLRSRLAQVIAGNVTPHVGQGGAGLGLVMIYSVANQLAFRVVPSRLTEATVVLHIAGANKDIHERGTSVHFQLQGEEGRGG